MMLRITNRLTPPPLLIMPPTKIRHAHHSPRHAHYTKTRPLAHTHTDSSTIPRRLRRSTIGPRVPAFFTNGLAAPPSSLRAS